MYLIYCNYILFIIIMIVLLRKTGGLLAGRLTNLLWWLSVHEFTIDMLQEIGQDYIVHDIL